MFTKLLNTSKEVACAFAVGFPEKGNSNFYISHYLINNGEIIGIHRKTHLGPTEKEVFKAGDEINVFAVGELNIGIQLCYETHFPELSYAQAMQKSVYFRPTRIGFI